MAYPTHFSSVPTPGINNEHSLSRTFVEIDILYQHIDNTNSLKLKHLNLWAFVFNCQTHGLFNILGPLIHDHYFKICDLILNKIEQ